MKMTETSTIATDLPDHLYGTRAGLFYLLNEQPQPQPESSPDTIYTTGMPVYRLEASYRVASPARRASRKTVHNRSEEPDIRSILLEDSFIFLSVEDRQRG
jgi:hypothetical protein